MKGILFKETLFRKVLSGEKTETRRIIPVPKNTVNYGFSCILDKEDFTLCLSVPDGYENHTPKPRYKKGETVYLKEPYVFRSKHEKYYYKFDYYNGKKLLTGEPYAHGGWKNKMFMPAKAARYFIKIENVRIELLQDITTQSILNEGIEDLTEDEKHELKSQNDWELFHRWKTLWDKINGKTCPFNSNPLVWVYEISLIKK